MSAKDFKIGLETDFLNGALTGVGNYCIHLVEAMMERDATFQFQAFSSLVWRPLARGDLRKMKEAPQQSENISQSAKISRDIRSVLARNEMARVAYRRVIAARFRRSSAAKSLDLFHAFRFVPPADIDTPVLPVVYDLSFARYPNAHPKQRIRELSRLGDVIEKAAFVQTISRFSKREIAAVYDCSPGKIVVAPPAASEIYRPLGDDVTRLDLLPFGLAARQYLLAVGTLEPRKNLKTLIAAYSQLSPNARNSFPLAIVGNKGWGNLDLPRAAGQMIQEGSLRFLGSVPDAQLRSLYEGAIALMFPSVYEGFGMPAVEALACGTQVAHSSGTSMDEITDENSLRVTAMDVDAWTIVMQRLLDDRAAATTGRAARRARSQIFSWAQSAETILRVYAQLS